MSVVGESLPEIRFGDLPADVRAPSIGYAWRHIITIGASIYLLLALAYALASYLGHPAAALLVVPFLGAQIYKITIVMHDACHYSLLRNRTLNAVVGTVAGWFIGTSFKDFSRLHWRHHARYGEEDDPQGDDYLHLESASQARLAWHLVRPLVGYNLFKLVRFALSSQDKSTASIAVADRANWRERLIFLAGTAVVQLSMAAVATGFLAQPWLVLLFPISAATFALFFSQTRGFAEHVANPGVSPVHYARTHLPNWFDRLFFYTLNFNYHIEHHKYPSVPSCHLPQIHAMMQNDPNYGACSDSIVRTVVRRWQVARGRG